MTPKQFARFAWVVLGYAVAVMVWGAIVRATSSGAGCGAHWPLCNGEVVPLAPTLATVIEFAHRATSGLILVLTLLLVWMAFRTYPAGHTARRAAVWSLIFVIVEALIGAGIVLLRLVENNASALRAVYIAAHLVNTLVLLGCYVWTAYAAGPRPTRWPRAVAMKREGLLRILLFVTIVVAATGAVVALGDTLFPARTLAEGLAADRDPAAHFLIRLRVWHPILATGLALLVVGAITQTELLDDPSTKTAARAGLVLVLTQVVLGAANVLLLAPLALQSAHLLVSYLLWVTLVWMWLALRSAGATAVT